MSWIVSRTGCPPGVLDNLVTHPLIFYLPLVLAYVPTSFHPSSTLYLPIDPNIHPTIYACTLPLPTTHPHPLTYLSVHHSPTPHDLPSYLPSSTPYLPTQSSSLSLPTQLTTQPSTTLPSTLHFPSPTIDPPTCLPTYPPPPPTHSVRSPPYIPTRNNSLSDPKCKPNRGTYTVYGRLERKEIDILSLSRLEHLTRLLL